MKVILVLVALHNVGPMAPVNAMEIKELPSMAACQTVLKEITGLAQGNLRGSCVQVEAE